MHKALLEPEIQQFIRQHTGADVAALALQKNPFPDVEWAAVLNQVSARSKAQVKLPTWFGAENIIYPSKVSVEQTSSEIAAKYKSTLISGNNLIDVTGGFGIDDYYFSKVTGQVTHCEMDAGLSAIAAHNFSMLGAMNIECQPGDSIEILKKLDKKWDWLYADPARRNEAKGKVFMLKDCLPDVPGLLNTYFEYTDNILIKTAPLLDITAGLNELHSVKEIHIVAVDNEVKELLWKLQKGFTGTPMLYAVNLSGGKSEVFKTHYGDDGDAAYGATQKYLYEPNSAIMKSGAFNAVARHYNLKKLHRHSHLYTSDVLIDFPGRRFIADMEVPFRKSAMKEHAEGKKMNVASRNFPLTVPEIKKAWKIKDGGNIYAFFTTNLNDEKIMLLCTKV